MGLNHLDNEESMYPEHAPFAIEKKNKVLKITFEYCGQEYSAETRVYEELNPTILKNFCAVFGRTFLEKVIPDRRLNR